MGGGLYIRIKYHIATPDALKARACAICRSGGLGGRGRSAVLPEAERMTVQRGSWNGGSLSFSLSPSPLQSKIPNRAKPANELPGSCPARPWGSPKSRRSSPQSRPPPSAVPRCAALPPPFGRERHRERHRERGKGGHTATAQIIIQLKYPVFRLKLCATHSGPPSAESGPLSDSEPASDTHPPRWL